MHGSGLGFAGGVVGFGVGGVGVIVEGDGAGGGGVTGTVLGAGFGVAGVELFPAHPPTPKAIAATMNAPTQRSLRFDFFLRGAMRAPTLACASTATRCPCNARLHPEFGDGSCRCRGGSSALVLLPGADDGVGDGVGGG